jgi:hypothetical protein
VHIFWNQTTSALVHGAIVRLLVLRGGALGGTFGVGLAGRSNTHPSTEERARPLRESARNPAAHAMA